MIRSVSEEEVYEALFMMKPWKAPGDDGFHAGVYQETLRPLLNKLVQGSFIPGRQVADNIILSQEVVHKIRRCKVGLSCGYILSFWIPEEVDWPTIVFCSKHGTFGALNGEKTSYFSPSWGLRQGDPISPYLFILFMERLGHLIHDVQANVVKNILDRFCAASGAKFSFEKSKFFLSPSSTVEMKRRLSQILQIGPTSDLGKY
ncbi:uncharacterized protein LOC120158187 [Hibiscus syriacus]|uniref:uncharacterized protein LOC120158187 n=1 Tax=Hibiscus syriacus TaxID=106335 RepID=UPI0019217811|nr:uncharacterized protein LOC120158187 [Hibiscus syriacus]